MDKLRSIPLPVALILLGAMAFVFLFVRYELGDVKAAGSALGTVFLALYMLFKEPPGGASGQEVTP